MSNKFILMDMDDERSKKIAEAIGNKTCKRIIDYLADNPNRSEEDISKDLKIPMNTVEYNLKKLLKTGLIEKSKKFFWSRRGKKIDLYNPAEKHIVISPKKIKPDMNSLKTIIPMTLLIVALISSALVLFNYESQENSPFSTFESIKDMKNFVENNQLSHNQFMDFGMIGVSRSTGTLESGTSGGASDYSTTNIQVEGVDEADIIKNDGQYIYVVSGNKIVIVEAYPADDMKILSEIEFLEKAPQEIFINGNKLIVFSSEYSQVPYLESECAEFDCIVPPSYKEQRTFANIYDITDKENPKLEDEISVTGNYFGSRMIGDYVYIITNEGVYGNVVLPSIDRNGNMEIIEPNQIYYEDVEDYGFQYTIVLAIDIGDGSTSEKVMLTGNTQNIYVSQNNIYTTFTEYSKWLEGKLNIDEEKTNINKISINKEEIEFVASGQVPGHILNQFSMDEFENNFRIATTIGEVWNDENPSMNNVYVLDEDLNIVGELEDLAPGEKIYSVRFMGKRGYVVTFKKVDPLFVIDLADPENPDVLGKLKIPGYSDYLHPYDETHIIGIGKDTVEALEGEGWGSNNFVWYQGVKMAIFDVSDVENPIEMHKVVIGDRGTQSEALNNHKAFLFDREKGLLTLPITLAEIEGKPSQGNSYGNFVFQGAYVYKIDLEKGFDFQGGITHYDEDEVEDKSGYYFYRNKNVQRSLFMDDVLYTFSNEILKANSLWDLNEISFVELPYESNFEQRYPHR